MIVPGGTRPRRPKWIPAFRWRRRRVLLLLIILAVIYVLIRNSPRPAGKLEGGKGRPLNEAAPVGSEELYEIADSEDDKTPTVSPFDLPSTSETARLHNYDGPIRFLRLGKTLREQAAQSFGYLPHNNNALFAMSSPKSVSAIIPMVCEMASWKRNNVHVAIMGRENITLQDILEIHGIDNVTCPAVWHDARPEYVEYSTDARAESTVSGAMTHIWQYLHPQVVIIDGSDFEDPIFARAIQHETDLLDVPLIKIPEGKVQDLTWVTRLDIESLSMWHKITINILIQIPPDSSNVLRLLRSITQADYGGMNPPHITLELPTQLDESVRRHLEDTNWPSQKDSDLTRGSFTMRRCVATHSMTREGAAIRFLELYYPTDKSNSHLLLLSPAVQLASNYFHYVMYTLLEYKYSSFVQYDNQKLSGISLELPPTLLDGNTKLILPHIKDMHTTQYTDSFPKAKNTPFVWQAPSGHAMLLFGASWTEFHSFLRNRFAKQYESTNLPPPQKFVSETLPSWIEYMVEFMRMRGHFLLYPAVIGDAFVHVHDRLYPASEKLSQPQANDSEGVIFPAGSERFLLPKSQGPHTWGDPNSMPLHLALPFDGKLPEISHMPQLLYNGEMISPTKVFSVAEEAADRFRAEVGGCSIRKGKHKRVFAGETSDLFCFDDEGEENWEDDFPDLADDESYEFES